MKKKIRLTETELLKLVKKIVSEQPITGSANQGVMSSPNTKAPIMKSKPPVKTSEDDSVIPADAPVNNKLWQEMESYIYGDGPEVMKFVPNKTLIIGTAGNNGKLVPVYTITKH